MKKKKNWTEAHAWNACAELLEMLAPELECNRMCGLKDRDRLEWYVWTVNHAGAWAITVLPPGAIYGAYDTFRPVQELAASLGQPAGIGVCSTDGGNLMLAAYTPPNWPEVVREDGSRFTVVVHPLPAAVVSRLLFPADRLHDHE